MSKKITGFLKIFVLLGIALFGMQLAGNFFLIGYEKYCESHQGIIPSDRNGFNQIGITNFLGSCKKVQFGVNTEDSCSLNHGKWFDKKFQCDGIYPEVCTKLGGRYIYDRDSGFIGLTGGDYCQFEDKVF